MLMKHLWTVGKTTTHDVFYQIEQEKIYANKANVFDSERKT